MKTQTVFDDIDALEKELSELAPLVRRGFDRAGGPSAQTEEAIRAEARRALAQRGAPARFAWARPRRLAAAAALALLLGGSAHLFVDRQPRRADVAKTDESAASFASLLLEIQGLNEESFFRAEGTESLWL